MSKLILGLLMMGLCLPSLSMDAVDAGEPGLLPNLKQAEDDIMRERRVYTPAHAIYISNPFVTESFFMAEVSRLARDECEWDRSDAAVRIALGRRVSRILINILKYYDLYYPGTPLTSPVRDMLLQRLKEQQYVITKYNNGVKLLFDDDGMGVISTAADPYKPLLDAIYEAGKLLVENLKMLPTTAQGSDAGKMQRMKEKFAEVDRCLQDERKHDESLSHHILAARFQSLQKKLKDFDDMYRNPMIYKGTVKEQAKGLIQKITGGFITSKEIDGCAIDTEAVSRSKIPEDWNLPCEPAECAGMQGLIDRMQRIFITPDVTSQLFERMEKEFVTISDGLFNTATLARMPELDPYISTFTTSTEQRSTEDGTATDGGLASPAQSDRRAVFETPATYVRRGRYSGRQDSIFGSSTSSGSVNNRVFDKHDRSSSRRICR
ncbi:hypothetical protein SeMB42_g04656 [Synchytrium endobioticum]|nr:hypothetical protein SeMB42_g04656 [Synchytrium endobioticum]